MFDFYESHKFICLVTLFLALVCLATLFEGSWLAAGATGLGTLGLVGYLWQLHRKGDTKND
ncbi:hypothetical protein ACVR05_01545 [Streptococcus caprae]|uniref:DUF3188 domain-containing protein n=1 Tax=Streptococcus caprae TaxID=1640501 RepID=A0ABV8CX74_9STRE